MARATPATSLGVSPFTRRPTSSAEICTGVASPAMTRRKASVTSSDASVSPLARRRIDVSSAFVGLPDTERLDQPLGKSRLRRDERDHQAEQSDALDILVDIDAVQRAVREIQHPH